MPKNGKKREKRKAKERERANKRKRSNGEFESNQQEIIATSDDVGPSDQPREPGLEPRDPVWEPKHKIFLSHSGFQKAFTEHLCEKLEAVHHFPFFDRREDCLRKGEKFYPPLMNAAKGCRVAVLVLSAEFFTKSKWPMMELNEFVKAQESDNKRLKILPLFFTITREEIDKRKDGKVWRNAWKAFKKNDKSIDLGEWKHALSKIPGNNGIQYGGETEGESEFIKKVVAAVCKLVPPDVKYDVPHVQSMERLSQPILNKLEAVEPSSNKYKVRVVGLYGMGGIGKTTISRAICNQMFGNFDGKVCHVDLGGESLVELRKKVLRELTEADPARLVYENDKLVSLLKERMHRQKVFLVLDNVWDHQVEEVEMYLNVGYYNGSMVLVTSRSLDIHKRLHIPEFEMPDLEQEGATNLFLHYTGRPKESIESDEWKIVDRCVKECFFLKEKKLGSDHRSEETYQYLPLALKVLGSQLGGISREVWRWEESLGKLEADKFNMMKDNVHPVFSVLRQGYDKLDFEERYIFLDLALVWKPKWRCWDSKLRFEWEWLCIIHRKSEADMKNSVKALQRKGLLDKVNEVEELDFIIHDLYVDFAEAEARAGPFEGRRFLLDKRRFDVPHELLRNPSNGLYWPSLERLIIFNCLARSLKRAKLHLCKNLEVLDMDSCYELEEVDVTGMDNLRCMVVTGCQSHCKWIGVEKLSNLVILRCIGFKEPSVPEFVDYLSSLTALQVLKLEGFSWSMVDVFPPDLRGCKNLREVILTSPFFYQGRARSALVDFGTYLPKSVLKIDFSFCREFVRGSSMRSMSPLTNLQDLNLYHCEEIEDLSGLCELISLQKLNLGGTGISELPDGMWKLKHLQFLDLRWCKKLRSFVGIANATALQRLKASDCYNLEEVAPDDFIGLKQLQFLDVSCCKKLTSIVGIANATALQRVIAYGCYKLRKLPVDFCNMEKVEMVDLRGDELVCELPKGYERLAGHPESEETLKVKVRECWGLIVPLVKKLRIPELSLAKCVDQCNCGCESMQLWINARKNVDGAAYHWLKNVISGVDLAGLHRHQWAYLLDVEEVDHFVIRALCEHDDRDDEMTNRLVDVVAEVTDGVHRDELSAHARWSRGARWMNAILWVVVASAPCTFEVVTERATLKPWRKTLLHYTIVRILPEFLYWRERMIKRRKVDLAGDCGSDWFMNTWSNRGIVTVLEKCKEKLDEADGQGVDPVRSKEGKKVVDTFLREIEATKGQVIKEDSILWNVTYLSKSYRDLFPNFPFERCLRRELASVGSSLPNVEDEENEKDEEVEEDEEPFYEAVESQESIASKT